MNGRITNLWRTAVATGAIACPGLALAPVAPESPEPPAPPIAIVLAHETAPEMHPDEARMLLEDLEASIRLLLSKRLKLILDFHQARLA